MNQSNIDEEYLSFMSELGQCSPPRSKSNSSNAHAAATHSTTTAADGGPLALTYDKQGSSHEAASNSEGSSNGQAKGLLPTPGRNKKSSSGKDKLVTWIQRQGGLF